MSTAPNNLQILSEEFGQSAWLDNLRRDWIDSGELQSWIEKGCLGITSNPTIFAKSMSETNSYMAQLESVTAGKGSASSASREQLQIEDIYWQLVIQDINKALQLLHPTYEMTGGTDGYVSLEVSPTLADAAEETISAAKDLAGRLDYPNFYIKVPATSAGIKSIRELVGSGMNINITLIFSLSRYTEVMDAYIEGLQIYAQNNKGKNSLAKIHSVASFFVSRVDTEIDRQLEEIGTPEAMDACGKAAVAQAQIAYQLFLERFEKSDFKALASESGANIQRPLWASVSTKNPDYPDTLYIDNLIGPDTVSTMPENTLEAFLDHGKLARTLDADPGRSRADLERLAELGIDMEAVSEKLETEGVSAFSKSFDDALTALSGQLDAV